MRWVGLVRNVMLGREGLDREVLLGIVDAAGGTDARNHLTTGNVTFAAPRARAGAIARRAEAGIAAVIGRHEPVILREITWLQNAVEDDPFEAYRDGTWELEVGFLHLGVAPIDPARLPDPERTVLLRVGEREAFTARPHEGRRRPHVVPLLEDATGSKQRPAVGPRSRRSPPTAIDPQVRVAWPCFARTRRGGCASSRRRHHGDRSSARPHYLRHARQAEHLGRRLAPLSVNRIAHGPLPRAAETARVVAEKFKQVPTLFEADAAGDSSPPARSDEVPDAWANAVMAFLGDVPEDEASHGAALGVKAIDLLAGPAVGGR